MHAADRPPQIAIIGGGWAGLACADQLLQAHHSSSGPAIPSPCVTLFESAPIAGGRARGLDWHTDDGRQMRIDNGQHLTIGAYAETLDLLARCDANAWQRTPLVWSGVGVNGAITHQWVMPDAGWPWRLMQSWLPAHRPKGWPMLWRRSLMATLTHLVRRSWQSNAPAQTARQWLEARGAPSGLVEHFWRPLIEGALNTSLEDASATVACQVLKDSIAGDAHSVSVWQPVSDLSQNGVDPIVRSLVGRGLRLQLGHRVMRLHDDGRMEVRKSNATNLHAFDAVIMALPHHASLKLWQESDLPVTPVQHRWESLESRAITTIWVALNHGAKQKLSHLPQWFMLNPSPGVPHVAQVAAVRGDVMALVISAQDPRALMDPERQ